MSIQVRDYIAARSSHPSGTHLLTQGGDMKTQPLPSKPHLDNGPQPELTRDIWDLDYDQLCGLLKAFLMEIARREWVAPPHRLPQGQSEGNSEANMDDGKVGL